MPDGESGRLKRKNEAMKKIFSHRFLQRKTIRWSLLGILLLVSGAMTAYAVTSPPRQDELFKTEVVVKELPPIQVSDVENRAGYWLEEAAQEGDTLYTMLSRYGLSDADIANALKGDGEDGGIDKKLQRLRSGQTISVLMDGSNRPAAIQFFNDDDNGEKNLIAIGKIKGEWQASASEIEMKTLPTLKSVVVRTSAKGSLAQAGVGIELRESLRDIFSEQFNLDDLKEGDQIRLLYNSMYFRGQEMAAGDILAVEIVKGGKTYQAYYYDKGDEGGSYYDYDGEPLKSDSLNGFAFMPLQNYTRISSPYGIRVHPVLHTVKMHTGIDYAAPPGTPVYAPADGTLTFKGWKGGYGYTVMLMHSNGVETLYGHLSAFSPSKGHVKAGEVIGFVGSTGRSTGPHLHYEARINGQHVNPTTVALPTPKMEKIHLASFLRQRQKAEDTMAVIHDLPVTVAQLY